MQYKPEDIYEFAKQHNGVVLGSSIGGHSNLMLAKMPLEFPGWYFGAWFDFYSQEANGVIYQDIQTKRGLRSKFQYSITTRSIEEYLKEVQLIILEDRVTEEKKREYFLFVD